jgi:hypothetical protein
LVTGALKKSLNGPLIETARCPRFLVNPLFEMKNLGGVDLDAGSIGRGGLKKLSREEAQPLGAVATPLFAQTRI